MTAQELIAVGRGHELAGLLPEATLQYEHARVAASDENDPAALTEALRRLGVTWHRRGDKERGRDLALESLRVAEGAGHGILAAEALNCLAGFDLESASYDAAEARFLEALALGGDDARLRGRIEQNLGILANIRGDLDGALGHYGQALEAFQQAGDRHGAAIVYHNLGMIGADQLRWTDASRYFEQSHALATELGDVQLRGLCLLNHTEVFLAQHRYDDARRSAESALQIFDELHSDDGKAAAHRFLGILDRETGDHAQSETHLVRSLEIARGGAFPLDEAETLREVALLYMALGRNQEALRALDQAKRIFNRLQARRDLTDVHSRGARLEAAYLEVVRNWGQSIESADQYTFGHCERVASYAGAVARSLNLGEIDQTTIRVGAYLHDVGKVRVPAAVLNKPGKLTPEELALMQQHTIFGIELLAATEFPWDIRPIIRWHHERADGSGYPDALQGDEIPLHAQIIGIVDVWDALTTDRPYRGAMPYVEAMEQMNRCARHWAPLVYEAFLQTVTVPTAGVVTPREYATAYLEK